MTVAELIEELRKYPGDMLVAVWVGSKYVGHFSNANGVGTLITADKKYIELTHDDSCI